MDAKMLYVQQEIVHETIIEIFKIFSHCQIARMASARFRPPKTEEEEISLLSGTVPKNTKYNTKWAVNIFTAWQNTRMKKKAQLETSGGNGLESTNVEDLSVPLEPMSADSSGSANSFVRLQTKPENATLLGRCTYLFAALIAIWETHKEKRRLTYWRKVTGAKTTFFEAIFNLY